MIKTTIDLNTLKERMRADIFASVQYVPMPTMTLDGGSTVYQSNLEHFIPEITEFKKNLEIQIQNAAAEYQNLIQNKENHFRIYTEKVEKQESLLKMQEELRLNSQLRVTDIHNLERKIQDNLRQAREFAEESEKIRLKIALGSIAYIFAPKQLKNEVQAMERYREMANRLFESPRQIEWDIAQCRKDIQDIDEEIQKYMKQEKSIQEDIRKDFSDIEAFHMNISDQLHHLGYLENLIICIKNHMIGSQSDQEILETLKQDPEVHHYAPSKMNELMTIWNEHHDDQVFHDYIMRLANL